MAIDPTHECLALSVVPYLEAWKKTPLFLDDEEIFIKEINEELFLIVGQILPCIQLRISVDPPCPNPGIDLVLFCSESNEELSFAIFSPIKRVFSEGTEQSVLFLNRLVYEVLADNGLPCEHVFENQ